jgi:hypothetical protein
MGGWQAGLGCSCWGGGVSAAVPRGGRSVSDKLAESRRGRQSCRQESVTRAAV